jgi:hypothetical protein
LEVVGTAVAARPYQDGGSDDPEWRWDLRADAGTYNATLSFSKLIFAGASVRGAEIPPGSPIEGAAGTVTPLVDGAQFRLTVLTLLGLTLWQQNVAMAVGGIVATTAAALGIIGRARARLKHSTSGTPTLPAL